MISTARPVDLLDVNVTGSTAVPEVAVVKKIPYCSTSELEFSPMVKSFS
jgi:hypothetical protein